MSLFKANAQGSIMNNLLQIGEKVQNRKVLDVEFVTQKLHHERKKMPIKHDNEIGLKKRNNKQLIDLMQHLCHGAAF